MPQGRDSKADHFAVSDLSFRADKARLITVLYRAFAFLACSCIAIRFVGALFQGVASEENKVVVGSASKANINH